MTRDDEDAPGETAARRRVAASVGRWAIFRRLAGRGSHASRGRSIPRGRYNALRTECDRLATDLDHLHRHVDDLATLLSDDDLSQRVSRLESDLRVLAGEVSRMREDLVAVENACY